MVNNSINNIKNIFENMDSQLNSDSPFDPFKLNQLNMIRNKVIIGNRLTTEESKILEELQEKIKKISSIYNNYDINKNLILTNLINEYQLAINNHNTSYNDRQKAIQEISNIIKSNNVNPTTRIPLINKNIENIINNSNNIKNGIIDINNLGSKTISPFSDIKNSTTVNNFPNSNKTSFKNRFLNSLGNENSGLHNVLQGGLNIGLSAFGLGDINKVFNSSSSIIDKIVSYEQNKQKLNSDISLDNNPSLVKNNENLDKIDKNTNYSNKLLENIYSQLRGNFNNILNKSSKNEKEDSKDKKSNSIFQDLFDTFTGKGKNGKLGKGLSILGGKTGKIIDGALSAFGLGGISDIASTAIGLGSTAMGTLGTVGSKIGGIASNIGSKIGIGGLAKGAGKLGKFLPGIGTAIAVGSAGYSAYKGFDNKQADELFGNHSTVSKIGSSLASVGNDLTFGLVDKKIFANVEKSLGKKLSGVFDWISGKTLKNFFTGNSKENKDDNSSLLGIKPDEIKSMFSNFGNAVSNFTSGIGSFLSNIPGFLGKAVNYIPGVSVAKDLYTKGNKVLNDAGIDTSNLGGFIDSVTGKSSRYGGSNDGSYGNTGNGKKLSKVIEERKQILYNAARDAGMDENQTAIFMGQHDQETGGFQFMRELSSGKNYEGRTDLGNVNSGDGAKYKGRGYNQLTGRSNYKHYGDLIGEDLVNHPELAENPEISAKISVAYFQEHQKQLAKKGIDIFNVDNATQAINGGFNGIDERRADTEKWKKYLANNDNELEKNYQNNEKGDLTGTAIANNISSDKSSLEKSSNIILADTSNISPVSGISSNVFNNSRNDDMLNSQLSYNNNIPLQSFQPKIQSQDVDNQSSIVYAPEKDSKDTIDDFSLYAARNLLFG